MRWSDRWEEDNRLNVQHAAMALDELAPGWASRIDVGLLNLMSPSLCVLGQTFRAEWRKPQTWFRSGFLYGVRWMRKRGDIYTPVFACPVFEHYWINEIADRVAGRSVEPSDARLASTAIEAPVLATRA